MATNVETDPETERQMDEAARALGMSRAAYVLSWVPEAAGASQSALAFGRRQSEAARAGARKRRKTSQDMSARDPEGVAEGVAEGVEAA